MMVLLKPYLDTLISLWYKHPEKYSTLTIYGVADETNEYAPDIVQINKTDNGYTVERLVHTTQKLDHVEFWTELYNIDTRHLICLAKFRVKGAELTHI